MGGVGGMGGMLCWVVWVACLRWWHASVGGVGGMLAWVACYRACVVCVGGRANLGYVVDRLAWVTWQRG